MFHIVVNPTAGGGRAKKIAADVENSLREKGMEYQLHFTECPGHATDIARSIADEGGKVVISVGGDGTLQEVVNGIAYTDVTLGVIPAGTGNDFIRMLNVPVKPIEALEAIYAGKSTKADLGLINGRDYFLNAVGTGIDVDVVQWVNRIKKVLHGLFAYGMSVFFAIVTYKPKRISFTADGKTFERYVTMCVASNGKTFGGGMRVTPHADMHDGVLDVCIVKKVPRIRIPFLFPKVIKGTHVSLKITEYFKCEKIEFASDKPYDLQSDGELNQRTPVKITVAKQALNVFCG